MTSKLGGLQNAVRCKTCVIRVFGYRSHCLHMTVGTCMSGVTCQSVSVLSGIVLLLWIQLEAIPTAGIAELKPTKTTWYCIIAYSYFSLYNLFWSSDSIAPRLLHRLVLRLMGCVCHASENALDWQLLASDVKMPRDHSHSGDSTLEILPAAGAGGVSPYQLHRLHTAKPHFT